MLPTPSTSHVAFDHIYEPAEDSFLLLDTLSSEAEIQFLKTRFGSHSRQGRPPIPPCPLILEVGTGSGVILAFITAHAETLFGRTDILTLGTDVNGFACQATRQTVVIAVDDYQKTNPGKSKEDRNTCSRFLGPVQGDLASPLRDGAVDLLIFNPPYVPTAELPEPPHEDEHAWQRQSTSSRETLQENSYLLSLSYAGGVDGMEITDRLLNQIPAILSQPYGVAYIVLCAQNRPEFVKARIRTWAGHWYADTVGHTGQKGGWEKLQVLRIWRDGTL